MPKKIILIFGTSVLVGLLNDSLLLAVILFIFWLQILRNIKWKQKIYISGV